MSISKAGRFLKIPNHDSMPGIDSESTRMNVLITAGGTREKIDSVRSITNTATGRLGYLLARCFDRVPETERIFYVCGKTAPLPESPRAVITVIDDTAGLEAAVRKILRENPVDAIIHSMAVSDYRVRTVTTPALVADAAALSFAQAPDHTVPVPDAIRSSVAAALEKVPALGHDTKISSHEKRLVLILEPTPKIISLLKDLAPQALITGFKLLDHVSHETLIDTAFRLLEKNRCNFVLANDAKDIHGDTHTGYLVDSEKNIRRLEGKPEIAEGITNTIIQKLKERSLQ
jgi:phosphopantothenate-cysteine ligase